MSLKSKRNVIKNNSVELVPLSGVNKKLLYLGEVSKKYAYPDSTSHGTIRDKLLANEIHRNPYINGKKQA